MSIEHVSLPLFLVLLGTAFKRMPWPKDSYIPVLLGIIGAGLYCWLMKAFDASNAIDGFYAGLSAVGINQLYRQSTAKDVPPGPVLVFFLASLVFWGCASNPIRLKEETRETNGTVRIRELSVNPQTFLTGHQDLTAQRITLSHFGFGVGQTGLTQDGGGTNLVDALKAASEGSTTAILKAFKP